jgi:hypothetical protein
VVQPRDGPDSFALELTRLAVQLQADQAELLELLRHLANEFEQVKSALAALEVPKPPQPHLGHAILPPVAKPPPLPRREDW